MKKSIINKIVIASLALAALPLTLGAADPSGGELPPAEPDPDPGPLADPDPCAGYVRPDIDDLIVSEGEDYTFFACTDETYVGTMPRILDVEHLCSLGGDELASDICGSRGEVWFPSSIPDGVAIPPHGEPLVICCAEGDGRLVSYNDSELESDGYIGGCRYAKLEDRSFKVNGSDAGYIANTMGYGGCAYFCADLAGVTDDTSGLTAICEADVMRQFDRLADDIEENYNDCIEQGADAAKTMQDPEEFLMAWNQGCADKKYGDLNKITEERNLKLSNCGTAFVTNMQSACDGYGEGD